MASNRVSFRAVALLAAAYASLSSPLPAFADTSVASGVVIEVIGLPESEALLLFAKHPMQLGLGVFPGSRDPVRFLDEIGYGAPPKRSGQDPTRGKLLPDAISELGCSYPIDGPDHILRPLVAGMLNAGYSVAASTGAMFAPVGDARLRQPPFEPRPRPCSIRAFATALEAERHLQTKSAAETLVLGLGARTPIQLGMCVGFCTDPRSASLPGVITGSITRRPGIVTPYDVAVTILDRLGVKPIPEGFAGNVLTTEPEPDATARIDSLTARLERDDSYAPGLAAMTVTLGVGSIIVGLALAGMGRRSAGARVAQAAVFVLPGWVVAIFVPSGRWEVRSAVVLGAVLLGASLKPRNPVRTMASVGFASAAVFAVLVAVAPLNPGGEPGLSIWGNPLVSWRFFGLQNVPAAIIASGVVVWGVIRGLGPAVLVAISVVAAVVIGAPTIGANFVGVLTFVFGASAAVTALARKRVALRHVVLSAAIAVGAFVLALLADAGSPVSHGGRAARRISSGGWSAAWDLIEGRIRLNLELIGDFTGGVIFVPLLVITLAALIAWGMRVELEPARARIAVLGGALMALASLVLEDSGFYSGAVLWFVAADAWLIVTLTSTLTPPESVAPSDGGG